MLEAVEETITPHSDHHDYIQIGKEFYNTYMYIYVTDILLRLAYLLCRYHYLTLGIWFRHTDVVSRKGRDEYMKHRIIKMMYSFSV